ncbi:uncharacterized protein LOC141761394 isoform X2 [Sebastes fasciatus]|uniref:uncharacterized protein LOC141761394 isoform X2 n=1 Tax=Sebastes fasciatus TaxID=394691 RepID=UPI003D9E246B
MDVLENGFQYIYNMLSSPASKYHGLLNQGATCYLNSVLQVLFMTEDFREAVERHTCETCGPKRIDRHLASLFDELKGYTAYTYNITKMLGIDNVCEQRDAAEYFEKILGLTSPEASQIFHGLLTHKTKCSTCRVETEADGAFWHLPLALVDSNSEDYSVVDGIKEYFRASDFSGENQMYCETCDAKSDATIKCVIKHHPEVLMLLLKRFEFDYRYMTYVKINRTVDVPYTLQIPTNQTYELYAVVDHFGDLRSGHYNATIKPQEEERWYKFNDDSVTLLGYQPFQVDNIEKSSSAYLLFYRKKTVRAAGACTQDREVSIPEEFPPATSDNYDQCPDVIKGKEREEVEEAAEVGNEPTVTVPIDRHEETGSKDTVSVGSRGGGLSPARYNEVKDQDSGVYARHSIRSDLHNPQDARAEKQRHEGDIMLDDEEDMGGNAQADDQGEKRETLSRETHFEVRDDRDSGRLDDVRQRRPQEGLEGEDMLNTSYHAQMHKQEDSSMHPQQVHVGMQKDEERMDGNRDEDGNEQPERRGTEKYLDRYAEHQENERLDDVRPNMCEDLWGKQDVGQDYDPKPVSVDKHGDGERMEIDDQVDKDRKSGKGKLLKITDLYYDDIQRNGGGSKYNMPKDNQRCKGEISSRFYQRHEQPRDVKGDEQQKREDDKHAQRKGTLERLDDVRQNRSEHVSTRKDAAKQAKEQEKKGDDEHHQRRVDSSFRQAGSSRVTENRGSVEKSQPKARNEDTMEGRHGSKQSKTLHVKIIEEETYQGVRRSSETKNITIETVAGTSQGGITSLVYNEGSVKRKSDPKTDAKVKLSEGVGNLKLNDSPSPKPQEHRTKEMSDAQKQTVGKKHAEKKRGEKKRHLWRRSSPLKQNGKEKKKRNKTTGCFSVFRKSRKNADQTSESD